MSKHLILGTMNDWVVSLLSIISYDAYMKRKKINGKYNHLFEQDIMLFAELFSDEPRKVYNAYCVGVQNGLDYNAVGETEVGGLTVYSEKSLIYYFSQFFINCGVVNGENERCVSKFLGASGLMMLHKAQVDKSRASVIIKPYSYSDFWLSMFIFIRDKLLIVNFLVYINEWYLCRKRSYLSLSIEEKNVLDDKIEEETFIDENRAIIDVAIKEMRNSRKYESNNTEQQIGDKNMKVRSNVFFVRRSTFKCIHNGHRLENIEAQVLVLNKNGLLTNEIISAGYCEKCNEFFILNSTFLELKQKGTPVCRIIDDKSYIEYLKGFNSNALASESILMQHGYNVRKNNDLTSKQRKQLLAILVDTETMTKSEIISYLDFFINQRKTQVKMRDAIEKWQGDRKFIMNYNSGKYANYRVSLIIRS